MRVFAYKFIDLLSQLRNFILICAILIFQPLNLLLSIIMIVFDPLLSCLNALTWTLFSFASLFGFLFLSTVSLFRDVFVDVFTLDSLEVTDVAVINVAEVAAI